MASPGSKQKSSPIKIKDYFTNPIHKIRQPAFTEVGFTVSALNTFVKNFTNRQNSKYISLQSIKAFIKSFTNNNSKLMQMYEDFFLKNFKIKDGMIEVQHFVEFFIKETNQQDLSAHNIKKIYTDLQPLNCQNLIKKAQDLQIPLTKQEGDKIVKMVNYTYNGTGKQISYQNFSAAITNRN